MKYFFAAAITLTLCVPARAQGFSWTKTFCYAGGAAWFAGMSLGLIEKGKANRTYDEYMAANTTERAQELYQTYEKDVKSANRWLIIGFSGLGVSVTSYLIDQKLSSSRYTSLDATFDGRQSKLAMLVRF